MSVDDDELLLELAWLVAEQNWQRDVLCAEPSYVGLDWFPERGGSTVETKRCCSRCLVMHECREFAVDQNIRAGIWGGTSERERRTLRAGAKRAA